MAGGRVYGLLLTFHIAAGTTALVAAAVALATSKGDRGHVYAGRAFTLGMLVVFLTAVPMTLIRPNLFLLLIAVFSFYLASTGWLRARNRGGKPLLAEWMAAGAMGVTAIVMCVRSVVALRAGDSMGIVLLAFGGIGGSSAIGDLYFLRRHRYRGTFRIADHLSRMLGGTIAAVTAFTVVNVRLEPAVLVWLTPMVALTPLIVYWNVRVRRQTTSGRTPSRETEGAV
jgi:hypothetical protein